MGRSDEPFRDEGFAGERARAAPSLARPPALSRREALGAALGGGLILAPWAAQAGEAPVYSDWLGRAIRGYDPVAYFREGRAREGASDVEAEWNGATWRFVSEENRAAFLADPEAYAPQYGGWCAYAVSQGRTASVEPDQWAIVDGKLYLNYNAEIKATWDRDRAGYIAKADANWPEVLE